MDIYETVPLFLYVNMNVIVRCVEVGGLLGLERAETWVMESYSYEDGNVFNSQ